MDLSTQYRYKNACPTWENKHLLESLSSILSRSHVQDKRIFEIGCGNGTTADMLSRLGYDVTGIDPSESGIKEAARAYPHLAFFVDNAYEDLPRKYGTFPVVVSLEVVEHCMYPRKFAKAIYDLLEEKGVGIISTPFHGYLKNLVLALFGRMDPHYAPLWDGGHIKFFSEQTMGLLLEGAGFTEITFFRTGRIAPLAKSMIAVVRK